MLTWTAAFESSEEAVAPEDERAESCAGFALPCCTGPATLSSVLERALVACLFVGSALTSGCSSDPGSESNPASGGNTGVVGRPIPSCVLKVIEDKCQRCHGNPLQHAAPVAFFSVDDFQAQYYNSSSKWWEIAADQVQKDQMPFVALNAPPTSVMPPVEPLTPHEKTILLEWLLGGAMPDDAVACL